MYFDIYYKNHLGNEMSLVREPYRLQTAELFDYSWEPYTESGYITDFSREIVKKSATLTISAETEQEYIDAVNKFYEVTELDILNMNPGRLYIGNQYMECYIISSSKEYDVFKRIDPGRKKINWSGKFKFDLVLYAERSEPKWGKFLTQN